MLINLGAELSVHEALCWYGNPYGIQISRWSHVIDPAEYSIQSLMATTLSEGIYDSLQMFREGIYTRESPT